KRCAAPPNTRRGRWGLRIAACCAPGCAPTSRTGGSGSRRSCATGWAAICAPRCSPAATRWPETTKGTEAIGARRPMAFVPSCFRGLLSGGPLDRLLGHGLGGLGRGLLRHRGLGGAGRLGGDGVAAGVAVAGVVALALGGLAVALAHGRVLLEKTGILQGVGGRLYSRPEADHGSALRVVDGSALRVVD